MCNLLCLDTTEQHKGAPRGPFPGAVGNCSSEQPAPLQNAGRNGEKTTIPPLTSHKPFTSPEMKFIDIILTKDLSLLLHAIHNPYTITILLLCSVTLLLCSIILHPCSVTQLLCFVTFLLCYASLFRNPHLLLR